MEFDIPLEEARASAQNALRRSTTKAVEHLRESLIQGTFHGGDYTSCFYGKLAEGSGVDFADLRKSHEARPLVRAHFLTLGLDIDIVSDNEFHLLPITEAYTPIEVYCFGIHFDTPLSDMRKAQLVAWCDEELKVREDAEKTSPLLDPAWVEEWLRETREELALA